MRCDICDRELRKREDGGGLPADCVMRNIKTGKRILHNQVVCLECDKKFSREADELNLSRFLRASEEK